LLIRHGQGQDSINWQKLGDRPLEEAAEQDRRFLHTSHEMDPEGFCSRHLAQAVGGGVGATHGLRPRHLRQQHRSHRGGQGNHGYAPLPRTNVISSITQVDPVAVQQNFPFTRRY